MSLDVVKTSEIGVPECVEDQINDLHLLAYRKRTAMVEGLWWYGEE
jgi:hypothetical protein